MKPIHAALKTVQAIAARLPGGYLDEHWTLHIDDAREERAKDVIALAALRDAHNSRVSQLMRDAGKLTGSTLFRCPQYRLEVYNV